MASLLQYGGAIGGAISDVAEAELKRQMQQQEMNIRLRQQDESERSNRSRESYQDKALQENIALRMLQQDQLNQNRQNIQDEKENSRVLRTINLRPIGSPVTEDEFTREQRAGVPASLYDVKREGGHLTGEEQGPTMSQSITSKGTPEQLMGLQRIQDAKANADRAAEDRDLTRALTAGMFQTREGRMWAQQPDVVIVNPENPGQLIRIPRATSNAMAQGGTPFSAPLSAGERQAGNALRDVHQALKEVESSGDAAGWKGIGPVAGTVGNFLSENLGPDSSLAGMAGANGEAGQILRDRIGEVFTSQAFAEGGKNLTGTERDLVSKFRAQIKSNPQQAQVHLKQALRSIERRLQSSGQTTQRPETQGPQETAMPGKKRQVGRFVIEE